LLGAATLRTLRPGQALFARGDPPCGLYGVVTGALRISGVAESGKEALLAVLEPPSWFGEISVFDGLPRTHDAAAETECVLAHVTPPALAAILDDQPGRWRDLGVLLASQTRVLFAVMEEMALLPLAARLARRLALMAAAYGEWRDRTSRTLEISQEQLARMLATSRQTANQLLKDLEAQGLIRRSRGKIEILDLAGLRAAAATARTD
jgi:CRP-like cAMP-binding protein